MDSSGRPKMHRIKSLTDTIEHEGIMEKRGLLQTWSKYHFNLLDEKLSYHKVKEEKIKVNGVKERKNSIGASQGSFDLSEAQCVLKSSGNHGFQFEIIFSNKSHMLSCNTEEGRTEWMKYLQDAMQIKRRKSTLRSVSISHEEAVVEMDDESDVVFEANPIYEKGAPPDVSTSEDISPYAEGGVFIKEAGEMPGVVRKSLARADSGPEANLYEEINDNKRPLKRSTTIKEEEEEEELYAEVSCTQKVSSSTSNRGSAVVGDAGESGDADPASEANSPADIDSNDSEVLYDDAVLTDISAPIPQLPHPQKEHFEKSAFLDIKTFLEEHRGEREAYPVPRKSIKRGNAINRLKSYLSEIETS